MVIVACATSLCATFAHMGMEALGWDIQECNASAEFSRVAQRSHTSPQARLMACLCAVMVEDGKEVSPVKGATLRLK